MEGNEWRERLKKQSRVQRKLPQDTSKPNLCVCVWGGRGCLPKLSHAGMKNEEALKEPGVQNIKAHST